MKLIKLCAVLVAVAALHNAAFGVISLVYEEANPIKGKLPGDGFNLGETVQFKVTNFDMGTLYQGPGPVGGLGYSGMPAPFDGGGEAVGAGLLDAYTLQQASGAGPWAPYTNKLEDGWGIMRVTSILDEHGYMVWTPAGKGHELLGIFWGIQDIHIEPSGQGVLSDRISGVNFNGEIYSVPLGSWNPGGGSFVRNPLAPNEYPGINDGAGPLNETLELALVGLPGFIHLPGTGAGMATVFESLFNPIPADYAAEALVYMELVGGASMSLFNADPFPMNPLNAAILGPLGFDVTADMHGHFKADQTGLPLSDWLLVSNDPIKSGTVIPEPLTMLGLFMGLGGVGAYIRKRRMA